MLKQKCILLLLLVLTFALLPSSNIQAGVFGEVALSIGGTFPQGTFTRYADEGLLINLRATIHAPVVEFISFWGDFSGVPFSSESFDTQSFTYIDGGPTIVRSVRQDITETMIAGHLGLQLSNPTRRAFIRPRAALGIGLYNFSHVTTWTESIDDTTEVVLADETLDSQTSFGWRGLVGIDFFVTTELGCTVDFVYDHVFALNQTDGPDADAKLTSRFHGFTIGIVYMFQSDSP